MFEQSLLTTSGPHTSRRGWTTLLSFTMQATAVGILLMLPLLYSAGPPSFEFIQRLIVPPAAPASPTPSEPAQPHHPTVSNLNPAGLPVAPATIPRTIQQIADEPVPPRPDGGGVAGGFGRYAGPGNPILDVIASSGRGVAPPLPTAPVARPVITSHAMEAFLIRRVQPEYPALARAARIEGEVLLQAVIATDGSIENLHVISGHPMLVAAALHAVQQWRYRPYVLNGIPVEVETQVTVRFVLSH